MFIRAATGKEGLPKPIETIGDYIPTVLAALFKVLYYMGLQEKMQ